MVDKQLSHKSTRYLVTHSKVIEKPLFEVTTDMREKGFTFVKMFSEL